MRRKHKDVRSEQVRTWIGLASAKLNSIAKAGLIGQRFISRSIGAASNQIQKGCRHTRANRLESCDQVVNPFAWMKAAHKGYGRAFKDFSRWRFGAQPRRTDRSVQHNTKLGSLNAPTLHTVRYRLAYRNDPVPKAHDDRRPFELVMHGGYEFKLHEAAENESETCARHHVRVNDIWRE